MKLAPSSRSAATRPVVIPFHRGRPRRRGERFDLGAAGTMWVVTFLIYLLMLAAVPSVVDRPTPDDEGTAVPFGY